MPTAPHFGWWVVMACGLVATCSWGFGFYGLAVYMDGLHRAHGWSTALLSLAVTVYYLAGAAALVGVGALFQRLGPAVMMAGGAVAMGAALVAVGLVRAPWQLFAAAFGLGVGNVITLQPLLASDEFGVCSFGPVRFGRLHPAGRRPGADAGRAAPRRARRLRRGALGAAGARRRRRRDRARRAPGRACTALAGRLTPLRPVAYRWPVFSTGVPPQ